MKLTVAAAPRNNGGAIVLSPSSARMSADALLSRVAGDKSPRQPSNPSSSNSTQGRDVTMTVCTPQRIDSVDRLSKTSFCTTGCLQLLELLEISWSLKLLLEILEVSWNLVDAPGKFYN